MYPIMGTAMYGSIYITLAVSIERYLGKYKWQNLKKNLKRGEPISSENVSHLLKLVTELSLCVLTSSYV